MHAPVKIGVAKNIETRLGELQVGNSRSLMVLAKLGPFSKKQAYRTENGLHHKFRKHRIRGEWFSGVILQYMDTVKSRQSFEYCD